MFIELYIIFSYLPRFLNNSSLSFTQFGKRESDVYPIVFLHGVFGSKINFNRAAKHIAEHFKTEVSNNLTKHTLHTLDYIQKGPGLILAISELLFGLP